MYKKVYLILTILAIIFVLSACSTETSNGNSGSADQQKQSLYENHNLKLKVYETNGWSKIDTNLTEHYTDSLNIPFENGKVKAIVTVVSTSKDLTTLKNEVKASAGNIEIIEDSDSYLAFKSLHTESIRTDVYFNQDSSHTGIIIFMTPLDNYNQVKDSIIAFKNNVDYNK